MFKFNYCELVKATVIDAQRNIAFNYRQIHNFQTSEIKINQIIEKMIVKNPTQWIWSHNRWK